jgi:hypothetical protein
LECKGAPELPLEGLGWPRTTAALAAVVKDCGSEMRDENTETSVSAEELGLELAADGGDMM